MDVTIFKKMMAKPQYKAAVLYLPVDYPRTPEMGWDNDGQADFVHLFVESREQFAERFPQAEKACKDQGVLWISYPKSEGKKRYDINRDSLWGLLLSVGFHPVTQVSLDEGWSAVRAKKNEGGVIYDPPNNVKKTK
jgi:hypothetical protein